MGREEVLGRVATLLRAGGTEDAEILIRELEKGLVPVAWGVPADRIFFMPEPPALSPYPADLTSDAMDAIHYAAGGIVRNDALRTMRTEIDYALRFRYLHYKGGEGRLP